MVAPARVEVVQIVEEEERCAASDGCLDHLLAVVLERAGDAKSQAVVAG
jgi:hypothetical protein